MLLALIFIIGSNEVESMGFTGATMLTPLIAKPDDTACWFSVVSVWKQLKVLIRKQATSESLVK